MRNKFKRQQFMRYLVYDIVDIWVFAEWRLQNLLYCYFW